MTSPVPEAGADAVSVTSAGTAYWPQVTVYGGNMITAGSITAGSAATTITVNIDDYFTRGPWDYGDYYRQRDAMSTEREAAFEHRRRQLEREREANQRRLAAEREERRLAQARANERARELLVSLLNEEQRTAFGAGESFEVVGSLGNRYRICSNDYQGNVHWLDEQGEWLGELCAHPLMEVCELGRYVGSLPIYDAVIGQMLLITTDERRFLETANLHSGRRPELALAS